VAATVAVEAVDTAAEGTAVAAKYKLKQVSLARSDFSGAGFFLAALLKWNLAIPSGNAPAADGDGYKWRVGQNDPRSRLHATSRVLYATFISFLQLST